MIGKKTPFLLLAAALVFSSCVGVATDIVIHRDGSGTIAMEYRLSREFESLGKLDGNERWPPLPVGKADFERTVARVEGLSLRSFTTKTTEQDVISQAKLDFTSLEALVRFLDASGQRATLTRDGGKNRLTLGFNGAPGTEPELLALVSALMEGYSLNFSLTLPANAELHILDGHGGVLTSPPVGIVSVQGTKAGFSSPMADLLSSSQAVNLEILW
ncbi:hypothetical protein [Treponema primitia]|uniref:hypothetical protein n=1 Tax=Treponema primitia TaxID=88058 RepID=UPI0002555771|nr:hypothetical protein [Treponema primitia]